MKTFFGIRTKLINLVSQYEFNLFPGILLANALLWYTDNKVVAWCLHLKGKAGISSKFCFFCHISYSLNRNNFYAISQLLLILFGYCTPINSYQAFRVFPICFLQSTKSLLCDCI